MKTCPHPAVLYLLATAKERDMSVRELERKAGIAPNTIHRWEAECRTPNIDTLDKALGVFSLRMGVLQVFP